MSQTIAWTLPGTSLNLAQLRSEVDALARKAGLEFKWVDLEGKELDVRAEEPSSLLVYAPIARRLDIWRALDPETVPAPDEEEDVGFDIPPEAEDQVGTIELCFEGADGEDEEGESGCRMWIDTNDSGNDALLPLANVIADVLAERLGGEMVDEEIGWEEPEA